MGAGGAKPKKIKVLQGGGSLGTTKSDPGPFTVKSLDFGRLKQKQMERGLRAWGGGCQKSNAGVGLSRGEGGS